jgi:adenosyl cobinamide kinase/adenosyl cobinamide phosphate guanylyltransferase
MAARIERHRAERPTAWTTIEEPVDLERALSDVPSGSAVLLDCLTLWVSNLLEQELTDEQIEARARSAAKTAAQRHGSVVAVTNEVGSGVIPSTAIGRRYTDVLGRVNAIWAEAAQRTALVVAGKVLPLRGREVLLDE